MKVYSIGRENGCDIIINDNSDVISRRHATLNVSQSGKMTIVDLSHNGTYVNGIRIAPNVPVPVTRKDNISFAHVARLDWNVIPNTGAKIVKWVSAAIVALLLVIGSVWGIKAFQTESGPDTGGNVGSVAVVDSAAMKKEKEKIEEAEKLKQDSMQKQAQDSIKKRKNAVKSAPKKSAPKKSEPKKDDANKDASTKTRVRG